MYIYIYIHIHIYIYTCTCTLRGLNFAGIKFRGFRGFLKNREIKSK